MEENQVEEKKGWSWLGFFFAPYYYAGYGNVKKGAIYAIIGAFPLFGLIIGVISGRNARKELPIGKQDFNWKNVALTVFLTIASGLTIQSILTPNQEVETIKQNKLGMCPTATVEEMVNGFFGDPSWESDVTDKGIKFVNIGGDMTYANKPVRGVIQFTFSKDETSFEYQAFEINGVPQNQFIAGALLEKMCDSTK
jgi:hypothetical protein